MTVRINEKVYRATIVPVPKHAFYLIEGMATPIFPAFCAVAYDDDRREGSIITAPIDAWDTKGHATLNMAEIYTEVDASVVKHIRKYFEEVALSEDGAVCVALEAFVRHGTPITPDGEDEIIDLIGRNGYRLYTRQD